MEQHKIEILAKQQRTYNGHQWWSVLIRADGGPKQVVFFRIRYDLTETNETYIQKWTLGVFMYDMFCFCLFILVCQNGNIKKLANTISYKIYCITKLRNFQWADFLPDSPERAAALDFMDPDVPGF